MGAKTTRKISSEKEEIMDDVTENMKVDSEEVDEEKLQALKERMKAKQKSPAPPVIVEEKKRSIKFGVIGSGQAGSRIAECFHKLGYETIVMNTATQDLEYIDIPESNKLLLDYGLGGASKELTIGREAAEAYRDAINAMVYDKLSDAHILLFATSLGGGSGAGSCETIVDILSNTEKPVVVVAALPMQNEDAQTKHNALQTLKILADAAQSSKIHNLIVVDNAKIETIYNDVNQMDFFRVSNSAIVEPIDIFNTLSSRPSNVKALDPTEFSKLLINGQGLTVYGKISVDNYEDETAIAEAVIENLDGNLLSGGFDLKQSKYVGVMIVAPKNVWSKIPSGSVNYAMAMVNDVCGSPEAVFKGLYEVESDEDAVLVYSMFSGLGLPSDRVEQLKKDAKSLTEANKNKEAQRNLSLKLDTGVEETVDQAQKIKEKIKSKNSAFGKLTQSVIRDRRRS